VVALTPLTAAQASLMTLEMDELLFYPILRRLRIRPPYTFRTLADDKCKEERSVKTESDSESYSTY
jgi:hypothetical protein